MENTDLFKKMLFDALYGTQSYHNANLRAVINQCVDLVKKEVLLLEELEKRMKEDVVFFKYKKTNGEVREAYGTLKYEIIAKSFAPTNQNKRNYQNRAKSVDVFSYFDIIKYEWRCFKIKNLLNIVSN